MKLLFESSFPQNLVSTLAGPYLQVERFDDPDATDTGLLQYAAEAGFHGVVFLGRQALGRSDVVEMAQQRKVTLLATETYNSIDAIDYLRENLGRIRRLRSTERALLVQSDGLRLIELDGLEDL